MAGKPNLDKLELELSRVLERGAAAMAARHIRTDILTGAAPADAIQNAGPVVTVDPRFPGRYVGPLLHGDQCISALGVEK